MKGEWGGAGREQREENDLAPTQVDRYLLVHRCDAVEKVRVIVWRRGARTGLLLNHYRHCTAADSGSCRQGVLP